VKRFLPSLLLLTAASTAQAPGHTPTKDIEAREEAATQQDRIGAVVDRELTFTDERGYPFQLRQLFPGKQPVLLLLGYYRCPAMCGTVLGATFDALSDVALQPGTDYRILSVSIDPRETPEVALERKRSFLPRLKQTGGDEAWRVLVGDAANTKQLADSVGFRYSWSDAANQYAHPPSLIFLTPEGKVSRIIVSTGFAPDDLRLAIVEASNGQLGTLWDKVRLNCLTFDARTNSYNLTAMTIMRIAGALTVVVLGAMIWTMLRRERRQPTPAPHDPLRSPSLLPLSRGRGTPCSPN
jgi:protein SCO1